MSPTIAVRGDDDTVSKWEEMKARICPGCSHDEFVAALHDFFDDDDDRYEAARIASRDDDRRFRGP